ncbi:hypothetical protein AURDEDRAFT_116041 [Auricularia subglabra TFB-10046 SS5]|nr:hypothetical protein AURDEDRAFT_116041 [Auricularia subglabra TFB-10046 SS5]
MGPLPPTSILRHVRHVHVNPPYSDPQWVIDEDFILQMCRLTHLHWHGDGIETLAQLSQLCILLTSPTLHSLTLGNVWLQRDASDLATISSGLRSLRIDFPHQVPGEAPTRPAVVKEHLACMNLIYAILRPRLESLTLSGYSVRLSSLAAAPWPSLRVFSITRGRAALDTSWETLLSQMPVLSSLTVALARRKRPTVLLRDVAPAPLSCLRHLTISSPHPDDKIFQSLPSQLQELSLRDSPRYYTVRCNDGSNPRIEPIRTCSDILRIFSVLSSINLAALELVYLEDAEEFRMLGLLSQSCPNLTLLELHRYPLKPSRDDAWYRGELTIPVDTIAGSLAEFKCLRDLKVNLCFTDYEVGRESFPWDYWDSLADFLSAQAYTIALRVPWVRTLSILTWNRAACGMHWDTWSVHSGDTADVPRLVHEDIYHRAFTGCYECDYF